LAPNHISVPLMIPGLTGVQQVACGSEHTVAVNGDGLVYSWGQGEGGLLGHGDSKT
jgi:alpha-tubulin suppressor-like RCC1 family protein